jgi:hypothetical protein
MAARLLQSFSVQGSLRAEDLARAGASLRGWVGRHRPEAIWRRGWPLRRRLSDGSELHGFADLVLEVREGLVLIDHKCLGGTLTEALAAYVGVLERATGRDVLGRWLHLPLQGVCVEVCYPPCSTQPSRAGRLASNMRARRRSNATWRRRR